MNASAAARQAPFVCIGHSHVKSLALAAEARGVPFVPLDFWVVKPFEPGEKGTRFREPIRQELERRPVFSVIGGNTHHKLGLVRHPRPFDFVLPEAPHLPLDEEAEVVPFDGVHAAVMETVGEYLDIMRLLRRTVSGPLFHLEPPPVSADEARLAADVPWMFFHGRRAIGFRYLRLKLWLLHGAVLREVCASEGITFVPCPAAAMDSEGFLRPEYYLDAMHVNPQYGALVLEQMVEAVRGRPVVSARGAAC